MSVPVYIPENNRIIHLTQADFINRRVSKPIYVVQYDKNLSLIAVKLYADANVYKIPDNIDIKIRWGLNNGKYVHKDVIGCNLERDTIYFELDERMTYKHGIYNPIIECVYIEDEQIVGRSGSSPLLLMVDKDPIQNRDLEESYEYSELLELYNEIQSLLSQVYSKEQSDNKFVSKTQKIMDIDMYDDISKEEIKEAIGNATPETDGLLSKEDKSKVDELYNNSLTTSDTLIGTVNVYTTELPLYGLRVIDGVQLREGDLVLVAGQGEEVNGIYIVNDYNWSLQRKVYQNQIVSINDGLEFGDAMMKKEASGITVLVKSPYRQKWATK